MSKRTNSRPTPSTPRMRCAIYTRKSTEEGLEQEFNSLDAQRESGEAFIKSQAGEGWECLSDRYDDGGFTGGNMDRPALKRLMTDIAAGRVDCVVVYKVDRLSRSLLDFARMMESFEKHQVSFVSVTQQFNTATSMGRLVLNVLLSFAQFEREIISERTRDKIAAARRKGKWVGGHPILGYDIDPRGFKLVVNEDEATRVRAIFGLYVEHQRLLAVIDECDRRGWCNKRWTTRKGRERGGKPLTKNSLFQMLTNVVYVGKIRYKQEVHPGEHAGIVDPALWQRVQTLLERNGRTGGAAVRNKFGALLKGLLRCVPCQCGMTPTHTTRGGNKRYRYYVCAQAQLRGWHNCPSKAIPAAEIERFVVDQIRALGRDPAVLSATVAEVNARRHTDVATLEAERRGLERELGRWHAEVRTLLNDTVSGANSPAALVRLAEVQERIRVGEQRATAIRADVATIGRAQIDDREIAHALSAFGPVWAALTPREQGRVVQLLLEQVNYDGAKGKIAITFHPSGIKAFAAEFASHQEQLT